MRPIILGMCNPLSSEPRHALFPHPPGCTGHRIWRLLCRRVEVSRKEYLDAFDRRNLLSQRTWDAGQARQAAVVFAREVTDTGRTILVLGEEPRAALGLPKLLVEPQISCGCTWRQLPHPSGRNLWYNDETCSELAAVLLEELYNMGRNP